MSSPFDIFRRNSKTLMVVLGVLCMFAFGVVPALMDYMSVGGRGSADDVAMLWRHGELTNEQLQRRMDERRLAAQVVYGAYDLALSKGRQPTVNPRQQLPFDLSASSTIRTIVLGRKAHDSGVRVNNETIDDLLKLFTANSVSREELEQLLTDYGGPQIRASLATVYDVLRRELMANEMYRVMQWGIFQATPAQQYEQFLRRRQEAEIAAVAVPVADFVSQTPDPTQAEIEEFFARYSNVVAEPSLVQGRALDRPTPGFALPPRKKFKYIQANVEALVAAEMTQVTEEQVREYYNANRSQYLRPAGSTDSSAPSTGLTPNLDPLPNIDPFADDGSGATTPDFDAPLVDEAEADDAANEAGDGENGTEDAGTADAGDEEPIEENASGEEEAAADSDEEATTTEDADVDDEGEDGGESDDSEETDPAPEQLSRLLPRRTSSPFVAAGVLAANGLFQEETGQDAAASDDGEATSEGDQAEEQIADGEESSEADAAEESQTNEVDPGRETQETPEQESTEGDSPADDQGDETTAPINLDDPFNLGELGQPDFGMPAIGETPADADYLPLEEVAERIRRQIASETVGLVISEAFGEIEQQFARYNEERVLAEAAALEKGEEPQVPPMPNVQEVLNDYAGMELKETELIGAVECDRETPFGASIASTRFDPQTGLQVNTLMQLAYSGRMSLLQPVRTSDFEGQKRFLVWITEEAEARTPELEEVREQVVAAWKQEQARPLAEARANELAEKAKAGEGSLSEALADEDVVIIDAGPFTWLTRGSAPLSGSTQTPPLRLSEIDGVAQPGPDFMQAVFSQQPGETTVARNHPQTHVYVIRTKMFLVTEQSLHNEFLIDPTARGGGVDAGVG